MNLTAQMVIFRKIIKTSSQKPFYHMTSLLSVINHVMTTRALSLSAGTSNVMTTVSTMHFRCNNAMKSSSERSCDKQNMMTTSVISPIYKADEANYTLNA